jgi:hypothetical protein
MRPRFAAVSVTFPERRYVFPTSADVCQGDMITFTTLLEEYHYSVVSTWIYIRPIRPVTEVGPFVRHFRGSYTAFKFARQPP